MQKNQFSLLKERKFLPYFCTQFLGAFNDTVFRNLLILWISIFFATIGKQGEGNSLVHLCTALFNIPFFLFSATAGQVANKYDKFKLIQIVKFIEIPIALLVLYGFLTENVNLLLSLLFLMGLQSTFFGPVKYSVLPVYLEKNELLGGNALVETATFLAILIGSIFAGALFYYSGNNSLVVCGIIIIVAILGYITSLFIPHIKTGQSDVKINWNLFSTTCSVLAQTKRSKPVFLAVIGISWFWGYGAVLLSQLPSYVETCLNGENIITTTLLAAFSVGISIGSLFCEKISNKKVEMWLVTLGSIGMTIFSIDIYFATDWIVISDFGTKLKFADMFKEIPHLRIFFDFMLIGVFGGFYVVPLYTLMQIRTSPKNRTNVIAGNNVFNALFMASAAILTMVLMKLLKLTITEVFLLVAILNILVAFYSYIIMPEFITKFLAWFLVKLFYRIESKNIEMIPKNGPVIIVCNHISFIDPLIIMSACKRPVRFVMDYGYYKKPVANWVFRLARTIPINSEGENPKQILIAFKQIEEALKKNQVVAIFPEGEITRNGEINKFKTGIERIVKRVPVPVIPVALQGLWGSVFSRRYKGFIRLIPKRLWLKVGIVFGEPVPPEQVSANLLKDYVKELRGNKL